MSRRSLVVWIVFTAIAGGALRAGMVIVDRMDSIEEMRRNNHGDEQFYFQSAQSLATTGEYREGYLRAYRPPGYPVYIALHLLAFGDSTLPVQITQNILCLIAIAVVGVIAAREAGPGMGILVAWILLLNPMWAAHSQKAYSEALFMLVIAVAVLIALLARSKDRWAVALLAGVAFGLSALVREIGMFAGMVTAIVLLVMKWRESGFRSGLRLAVPMVAGIALTILPWTLRNWSVLGSPVPITTNGPINFYHGSNSRAGVGDDPFGWRLPPGMQEIWNTATPGAELTVSRACGHDAVQFMLDHPQQAISFWPRKLWDFWGPAPVIASKSTADHLFRLARWLYWPPYLLLACYGMWLSRRTVVTWIILAIGLMATAIHTVTVGAPTYRLPWEMLMAIPVAIALTRLAHAAAGVIWRVGLLPDRSGGSPTLQTQEHDWDAEAEENVA